MTRSPSETSDYDPGDQERDSVASDASVGSHLMPNSQKRVSAAVHFCFLLPNVVEDDRGDNYGV